PFRTALMTDKASVGAHQVYQISQNGQPGPILDVIGAKFPSGTAGLQFLDDAQLVVALGSTPKVSYCAEDPGLDAECHVLRVPVPASSETTLVTTVFDSGVYYQISLIAPPGTVKDEQIVPLETLQAYKYRSAPGTLRAGSDPIAATLDASILSESELAAAGVEVHKFNPINAKAPRLVAPPTGPATFDEV